MMILAPFLADEAFDADFSDDGPPLEDLSTFRSMGQLQKCEC